MTGAPALPYTGAPDMKRSTLACDHEDPDLLRLNAMLHRMERDRCLAAARRSARWIWLCGRRRYRQHVRGARDHQSLAGWFQHMAERFDVAGPQRR